MLHKPIYIYRGNKMTKAIIKKELQSFKPFIILILSICLFNIVYYLIMGAQNLFIIDFMFDKLSGDNYMNYLIFYLIFSLSFTSGLIIREYDDKTIEYLSSMPVSLGKVLTIKFIIPILLISLILITDIIYGIITHTISRFSLTMDYHLGTLFSIYLLHLYQITYLIAFGVILSFFRRLSWIVIGILFWTFVLLENHFPELSTLNFLKITELNFRGNNLVIPWKMIIYQLPLLASLILISFLIFVDPGKKVFNILNRLKSKSYKKILLFFFTITGVALMFSILINVNWGSEGEKTLGNDLTGTNYLFFTNENIGQGTKTSDSQWFKFEYPYSFSKRALELIPAADPIYNQVSDFFNYKHSQKIFVDMKGKSQNYSGLAQWQNIYLNFSQVSHESEFIPVLGHELTHVFLESITERRLSDDYRNNKFFHEGLANYVEYSLFRSKEDYTNISDEAAISFAFRPLAIEELIDFDKFRRYYNHNLIYNFGSLFCETIIDQYGIEGVNRLLDIYGSREETFKLTGIEKWRSVFQYAQMDLDIVFISFQRKLISNTSGLEDVIESFKELKSTIEAGNNTVTIKPDFISNMSDWTYKCIVRRNESDNVEDLETYYLNSNSSFVINKRDLARSDFWYQLRYKKKNEELTVNLPWKHIHFD